MTRQRRAQSLATQILAWILTWFSAVHLGPVWAEDFGRLQMPVDCVIGAECSIQNFFDHDAGKGFRDYACGTLGYDGHDGTDFRLPNLAAMHRGVAVIAAAPGRVRAIRDGMADVDMRALEPEATKGREAGNAVVLTHGPDWETQYSHLLRGSVRVRPGDQVQTGDVLGMIGLSGNTEFPHLHFEVRYHGQPVDPFVGLERSSHCGKGDQPLWHPEVTQKLVYRPTGLLQSGFTDRAPDKKAIAAGSAAKATLSSRAPALVFWIEIFGAQAGDQETLRIEDPQGSVIVEKRGEIEKNKARWMSYAGRRRSSEQWPPGLYRATYRLHRMAGANEHLVLEEETVVEIR